MLIFSNNLRKLRLAKNMSQKQLADELLVTVQCVYKWESGQSIPDIENMIAISTFFNVDIKDLVNKECKLFFDFEEEN